MQQLSLMWGGTRGETAGVASRFDSSERSSSDFHLKRRQIQMRPKALGSNLHVFFCVDGFLISYSSDGLFLSLVVLAPFSTSFVRRRKYTFEVFNILLRLRFLAAFRKLSAGRHLCLCKSAGTSSWGDGAGPPCTSCTRSRVGCQGR